MKRTSIRLITALLAVMLLVSLGAAALAANAGTTVTKDGVKAQLYTDKESYASGNAVDARVKVDNETGKKISVSISIQVPNGVKLAGSASSAATVEAAKSYTTPGPKNPGSSTPGTGDGTPLLLLALLAVLSACGIGVWVIFGKKFRSMVSLLLVISMVAGMGLMAVPVKAADLEGTIELSCPIKIDGKAATVTAIVTYTIVGGAADETEPDESTPDESTPDESTPDESTPDESTPDESTPDESTPDESTPDESTPDESTPDESTPDESTPDESTPDESTPDESTPDETTPDETTPDESTPDESTPDETTPDETTPDEEEPGEDPAAVPTETAYYLIYEDFQMISTGGEYVGYSSWDYDSATAQIASSGGACYTDNSAFSDTHIRREFNPASENFTWEFTVRMDATMEGTTIDLRNGNTNAIRFEAINGRLVAQTPAGPVDLCAVPSAAHAYLKVDVDMDAGTYSVQVNQKVVAKDLAFLNPCTSVDTMYITTSVAGTGSIRLGMVRLYIGYYLNERFFSATIPERWTVIDNVTAVKKTGTQGPDTYSALMTGSAYFGTEVAYAQDGAWLEYQVLNPDNTGVLDMTLSDGTNTFVVSFVNGAFGYYDAEGSFQKLYDCTKNLWYHVMLKQTDAGTVLYLNHKEKATLELALGKFTSIEFESTNATGIYVDDIVLKDWIPYPDDYVPAPTKVVKSEQNQDILVGMQSCSLWVEGTHFGWDWLTDWEERTPVLGYYDEISPESADWELNYKVNHGIDFELYCWYRPQGSNGEPIKMPRNALALHEGYFNARYSDMMKFAITWECAGGPVSGSADFRANVVPYWIEQYFKDERYLVIDNKPVVGMYNVGKLMGYFGTAEDVKAELEYLRAECQKAGFSGCYIIMSNSVPSQAETVEKAGFDGQYAYRWGTADLDAQKNGMIAMRDAIGEGNSGVIAVPSMGSNDYPWDRDLDGGWATTEEFANLIEWCRDEFMTTLDDSTLGSRMVLFDNWNEYGEGHYIMPSALNGFGYVNAIRQVLGDGVFSTDDDVVPTAAQKARINHMYVQDRHVVRVDKDKFNAEGNFVSYSKWDFDDNTKQGWDVTPADGSRYSHELQSLTVTNGILRGDTHEQSWYTEKGLTSDASVAVEGDLGINADLIGQIKVRMKGTTKDPCIYFCAGGSTSYAQTNSVGGVRGEEDADGFAVYTFTMTSNPGWTGEVTKLRLDPITTVGYFEIDYIELLAKESKGDITVVYDDAAVVHTEEIKYINETVMIHANDIKRVFKLANWAERLDGTAIEVYYPNGRSSAFISLPYGKNEMTVNGETVQIAQGAQIIDGEIYIPLADVAENLMTCTVTWDAETKTMYIVTAAGAAVADNNAVVGWYYTASTEKMVAGGNTVLDQGDGTLIVTAGTDGKPSFHTGDNTTVQMYTSTGKRDVTTDDVTHLQLRIQTESASPKVQATVYLRDAEGNKTQASYGPVSYTCEGGRYAVVRFELASAEQWKTGLIIEKLEVLPLGADAVAADTEVRINSLELLDTSITVQDKSYYFDADVEGWTTGGDTGLGFDGGSLTVTPCTDSYRPRVWTCNATSAVAHNPANYGKKELTHIRVRARVEVSAGSELTQDTAKFELVLWMKDAEGNNYQGGTYTAEYPIGTEDFVYILFDVSKDMKEGATLQRINVAPISTSQELCELNAKVYIDSLQYQYKPGAEAEEPEQPEQKPVDPNLILGWTFDEDTTDWNRGGPTGDIDWAEDGSLYVTNTDANQTPRSWTGDLKGISTEGMNFVQFRIKADGDFVPNVTLGLRPTYDKPAGQVNVATEWTGDPETDGYYTMTVDLTKISGWSDITALGQIGFTSKTAGRQFYVDSVQFFKEDPRVVKVKVWTFDTDEDGWSKGGSTVLTPKEGGYLDCTFNGDRARIWAATDIATADVTHLRIKVKTGDKTVAPKLLVSLRSVANSNDNMPTTTVTAEGSTDDNDFYTIVIKLADVPKWNTITALKELGLEEKLDGCDTFILDSVELLSVADGVELTEPDPDPDTDPDTKPDTQPDTKPTVEDPYYLVGEEHFTTGQGNWSVGGTTGFVWDEVSAMTFTAPTKQDDYAPRAWSSNATGNVPHNPLNYAQGEITHIRLTMKGVLPEGSDQNSNMATLTVNPWFLDASGVPVAGTAITQEWEIGTDGYVTVLLDISSVWKADCKLGRFELRPISTNEALCKAGLTVYLDRVEYLVSTAASVTPEPDPDPDPEPEVTTPDPNAVKYWYFDTTEESWTMGPAGTVVGWADGTLHITNPGTIAGTWAPNALALSTENANYLRVRIKAATGVAPTGTIYLKCGETGGTYVDYKLVTAAADQDANGYYTVVVDLKEGDKLKDISSIYSLGFTDIKAAATSGGQEVWIDSVEILSALPEPDPDPETKPDPDPNETVVKAWSFDSSAEDWTSAKGNASDCADGAYSISQSTEFPLAAWSPLNLNIDVSTVTHIRVRVRTDIGQPSTLVLKVQKPDGSFLTYNMAYSTDAGSSEFATLTFDLSTDSGYATAGTIQRLRISGSNEQVVEGKTFWLDSVELLNITQPEAEPAVTVVKTMDTSNTKITCNSSAGSSLGSENGLLTVTNASGGMKLWMEQLAFDLTQNPVTHLRFKIVTETAGQAPKLDVIVLTEGGTNGGTMLTIPVTDCGTRGADGLYTVTVPLGDLSVYEKITQIGIADNKTGCTVLYIANAIELLNIS